MVRVEDLPCNLRSARIVEVVEIEVYEGHGTPESIGRIVTYYMSKDGNLLAKRDPAKEPK